MVPKRSKIYSTPHLLTQMNSNKLQKGCTTTENLLLKHLMISISKKPKDLSIQPTKIHQFYFHNKHSLLKKEKTNGNSTKTNHKHANK